jgi:hypothetical protein
MAPHIHSCENMSSCKHVPVNPQSITSVEIVRNERKKEKKEKRSSFNKIRQVSPAKSKICLYIAFLSIVLEISTISQNLLYIFPLSWTQNICN